MNREIELGDTYPFSDPFSTTGFGGFWFGNFGAVMLLGEDVTSPQNINDDRDWSKECLGSFYIKPNYPGRSSHVCNGGFLVTDASRNRGVGRLMGECYLEWAPLLGYTYSVFNLVYETNLASCRIWDALGFKRIGRVKGAGQLKSYPGQFIDAYIYGRDLGPEGEDYLSEERFEKIKFYLKFGKYPQGADRAEKSRLRSAVMHYKLLDDDRLMLRDKEVVPDGQMQYEIARKIHVQQLHAGINKTTGVIAEKYHWVRIKETVGMVIRNCLECKDVGRDGSGLKRTNGGTMTTMTENISTAKRMLSLPQQENDRERVVEEERRHEEQVQLGEIMTEQEPLSDDVQCTTQHRHQIDTPMMDENEMRRQLTQYTPHEQHPPPPPPLHYTGYQALLENDDHPTMQNTPPPPPHHNHQVPLSSQSTQYPEQSPPHLT
ncbi:MAG: hypothetical protein M1823_005002 [Watsoniomyces obsoletus]|nr:MAG: hypothetical protein M1823_005002 [Watsoniomyces obsoletus]